MPGKGPVSIYIHIPLCTKKCDYCHFYVIPNKSLYQKQIEEGLFLELEGIQNKIHHLEIASIYFGGGTPSLMHPGFFSSFLEKIPHTGAEVTLEVNPETVSLEKMGQFYQAGINRVSLGVQSLVDDELKTLSRDHGANRAKEAIFCCKEAGFNNITIDLMYDTPGQTLDSWAETLQQVQTLPITHLSLYNLTFEPNTVFYKKRGLLKKTLPDETSSVTMYTMAQKTLSEMGLKQYEISAFARDNLQSVHNTGYWTARPFLGLGPSAFSFWDGERFQNFCSISKWFEAVKEKEAPIGFSEKLEPTAAAREQFVIALRLLEGVKAPDALNTEVEQLITQGFLTKEHERVKLTQKGILFYDTVASILI
jgi:oxygen-independent coproporphyrinogen-3 oxidase